MPNVEKFKTTKMNTVTLSIPVKVDGKAVSEITLIKPGVGQLRGLTLSDILRMDVTALARLIPRVSSPPLTTDQVYDLDPADFADMAGKTVLFFVRKEQLEGQVLELNAT